MAGDELVIFCPSRNKTGYVAKEGRRLPNARCPHCEQMLYFDRAA